MSVEVEAEGHCSAQHVEEGEELQQLVQGVVASGGAEAGGCYRRFAQIVSRSSCSLPCAAHPRKRQQNRSPLQLH